jgi:hypothetical protein
MPDARCIRGLACNLRKKTHTSIQGSGGDPTFPRAMVLTVSFVLSPVIGLSCHRRPRELSRKLDASVEASEPHDFAVRFTRPRLKRDPRPPHPAPRS